MRNPMKRITISAIIMILGLSGYGLGQKEFMTVNGRKIEVFVSGLGNNQPGKPVIVLENGMATKYDYWENIINEVSSSSVVFAYNRPRIGESENDSLPPTVEHI